LGGLFNPEAYITATRQFVAQANGWSLEELMLEVLISDSDKQDLVLDDSTFGVTGILYLRQCSDQKFEMHFFHRP
jgi:dynein heavy chain 1